MKVVYSNQAKLDLHEIYEYIAFSLLSPENASGTTNRIMAAARSLENSPERNPFYKEEPWRSHGIRFTKARNYMIFYTVDTENSTINIVRIMYGGRDISRQLESSDI